MYINYCYIRSKVLGTSLYNVEKKKIIHIEFTFTFFPFFTDIFTLRYIHLLSLECQVSQISTFMFNVLDFVEMSSTNEGIYFNSKC